MAPAVNIQAIDLECREKLTEKKNTRSANKQLVNCSKRRRNLQRNIKPNAYTGPSVKGGALGQQILQAVEDIL